MSTEHPPETVVEHPTYFGNIRHFFEREDKDCMRRQGIDLDSYEGVKSEASGIHTRTSEGSMPPQRNRRWSEVRVQTFKNWIDDGYPPGEEQGE